MRRGLPVEQADEPEEGATRPRGKVVSWSVNPKTKELESIKVRWQDGIVSEHGAAERELRRPL